ncbi:MAG: hypothetical protein QNJ85_08655 [Gammaproteobacteria bacterium]|nr:hypothetical protein [Gammaproteobacteria bacterium]
MNKFDQLKSMTRVVADTADPREAALCRNIHEDAMAADGVRAFARGLENPQSRLVA